MIYQNSQSEKRNFVWYVSVSKTILFSTWYDRFWVQCMIWNITCMFRMRCREDLEVNLYINLVTPIRAPKSLLLTSDDIVPVISAEHLIRVPLDWDPVNVRINLDDERSAITDYDKESCYNLNLGTTIPLSITHNEWYFSLIMATSDSNLLKDKKLCITTQYYVSLNE